MKVDTDLILWLIENATQYQIKKETGVAQSTIGGLLRGDRKIENLTIAVGHRLTEYAKILKKSQKI